jgi:phasin family protein
MPSDPKFPVMSIPGAEEFRKLLGDMKLPALPDTQALMQAHQRNLEALTAANRIAVEGAQAVARRHMEIMQQTMAELTETLTSLSTAAPQDQAAKQAELLKAAYEKAVANSRELGDLIQRANGEAVGTLNARVSAAIDELTNLIGKARK